MSYVYGTRVSREHIKLNEHTCERTERLLMLQTKMLGDIKCNEKRNELKTDN